jgi:hypothetical protein
MSTSEGRGDAWTLLFPTELFSTDPPQERGTSDEGRRRLEAPGRQK